MHFEALGYGARAKQASRQRSDTKIHISIKCCTHFPCQLVTLNYKGWFVCLGKEDHGRSVIWRASYGEHPQRGRGRLGTTEWSVEGCRSLQTLWSLRGNNAIKSEDVLHFGPCVKITHFYQTLSCLFFFVCFLPCSQDVLKTKQLCTFC